MSRKQKRKHATGRSCSDPEWSLYSAPLDSRHGRRWSLADVPRGGGARSSGSATGGERRWAGFHAWRLVQGSRSRGANSSHAGNSHRRRRVAQWSREARGRQRHEIRSRTDGSIQRAAEHGLGVSAMPQQSACRASCLRQQCSTAPTRYSDSEISPMWRGRNARATI